MRVLVAVIWWACFIVIALILQRQLPGVDFLAPGFLLALQFGNRKQIFWLFLTFVLIQEGGGTLLFGMAILWYAGMVLLFKLSERFFVADNLLFVTILSASLGAYRTLLLWLMCSFVNIIPPPTMLVRESILQAVCIPIMWGVIYLLRPKAMSHVH